MVFEVPWARAHPVPTSNATEVNATSFIFFSLRSFWVPPSHQPGSPHLGPPHPGPTCNPPHTGPLCHPGLACHRPVPPCAATVCTALPMPVMENWLVTHLTTFEVILTGAGSSSLALFCCSAG